MRNYVLKNSPIDKNRVRKHVKDFIEEAKEDRNKALKAYEYFKGKVDAEQDHVAETCMVDCLKLAQTAKANAIRALEVLVKVDKVKEDTETEDSPLSNISFEELNRKT